MTADGDDLPNDSRVVRFVAYGRMEKDENDNFLRPLPAAFAMRDDEQELSVTWCEYFAGTHDQTLRCAVEAIRSSRMVGNMACFCVASASETIATIQRLGGTGRAIYLPEDDNPAHAGITGIDPENGLLLQALANDVWSEYLTKTMADALPAVDCTKSPNVG